METIVAPHIRLDAAGVAWIEGTATKVLEVVLNKELSGNSPEELQPHMPHLSLPQIYAAMAYYHDHVEEIEADIERRHAWAAEMQAQEKDPLTYEEMLARRRDAG